MRSISLPQLENRSSPADIAVQSVEGDIYLSFARIGDDLLPITRGSGELLRARSIDQMHSLLRNVPMGTAQLLLQTPYEEMIGLEQERSATGVPLAW